MSGILTLLVGALGGGVPTANLTAYLDVNNPSSYPGIGNIWYNVAPNGRSGTNFEYQNSGGTRFQYTADTTSGGAFILDDAGIFPETSSGLFAPDTANFTIETWVRWGSIGLTPTGAAGNRLALIGETFGNPDQTGYELTFEYPPGTTANSILIGSYNGIYNYTAQSAPQYRVYPGQWYHVVGTQQQLSSTSWRQSLYINGNQISSSDITNWDDSNLGWKINQCLSNDLATGTGNAAVSIVRTYNVAFSPSEVIYNYNVDSGRFVGGSHDFNGANSRLSAPAGTSWDFGTGAYTVEWFGQDETSDTGNAKYIFSVGNGNPGFYATVQNTGANTGTFTLFANGVAVLNTAISGYQNTWTNYAVSKNGTNTNLYINGTLVASNTADNTSINNTTSNLVIGSDTTGTAGTFYDGKITNFRVTKGQALYTEDFSPVTMPFNSDAIANVQLSLLATDSVTNLVDSSPRATPLVISNANVAWSNSTPFTQRSGTIERFTYTGGIQTWTAPADVSSIQVAVVGAAGGWPSGLSNPARPGGGAVIVSDITVTPGQTYYLMVGGQSANRIAAYGNGGSGGDGAQDGGAGGGMSGIFSSSVTDQANAIIIAGGGGGPAGRDTGGRDFGGGSAGGSNAAFQFYGSTASARSLGEWGRQDREDLYGWNGGTGGTINFPVANAVYNTGNTAITFNYLNPTVTNFNIFSQGGLTQRRATITGGSSTGNVYTLTYQGVGSTAGIEYIPGQVIEVDGANNANFNGRWQVISSSSNTVTFTANVENGGSANALGNIYSQSMSAVIQVSGALNANYNGTWSVLGGPITGANTTACTVWNIRGNPGPWIPGGNVLINAPGRYGNVFDTQNVWPKPGAAMLGGNGGWALGGAGGGGGGAGYWGGGGGVGGGDASGGGGGGASYWFHPDVGNVYYVGTNDIVGNVSNNAGNGVIMISY